MIGALTYAPHAYLYSYVSTAAPGYKKISIGGSVYTLGTTAAEGLLWSTFVALVDSAIDPAGWAASINAQGAVVLSGSSAAIVFPDRLGALLGFNVEPGTAMGTLTSMTSTTVPLGGIPLFGASWQEVDVSRSVQYEVDRLSRTTGYNWGGAKLWRWRITVDSFGLDALRIGWCMRGKVRIEGYSATGTGTSYHPISSSNAIGYMEGWPLGISNIEWLDDSQSMAQVDIMVSGGAA